MVIWLGEPGAHEDPYVALLVKVPMGTNAAHEAPYVALLIRVSRRNWGGTPLVGRWETFARILDKVGLGRTRKEEIE